MASNARRLRSGYTTGACAAAAAKAAVLRLLGAENGESVEIPFPDGSRVGFRVHRCSADADPAGTAVARASVLKDAGDDPDVTNGAEIVAEARWIDLGEQVEIRGGTGVGKVTKPGLPVAVGEPAINPVPRSMIRSAVAEALSSAGANAARKVEVRISVPAGEELAKKTLNSRLGILGGISILGTSGIVRPLSSEAWTSSIVSAMDVAKATGCSEIVLSVGRVSERAHMKKYRFPEEAYVMMGDYSGFSLLEAKKHGFRCIHLSSHWAKMVKIGMEVPQTHVRHGALDVSKAVDFLNGIGVPVPSGREFNTVREIYEALVSAHGVDVPLLLKVCRAARAYAESVTGGIPVMAHLVSYEGEVIATSE